MGRFIEEAKALRHAIEALDQHSVLIPEEVKFKAVLKECATLLKSHGHTVTALPKIMTHVKDLRGLVELFYSELRHYHPDTVPYRDEKVDLNIAKNFVKKIREITSLEYVPAIAICAHLIRITFGCEKEFGFKPGTLYNFRIFGQKEMKWVTEKALYIYNRQRSDESILEQRADIETEKYEQTHDIEFGYGSEEEIRKLIDRL